MPEKNKIHILYVENGIGYGGAIICLRHLIRNLDRTRFEPMVITGRTGLDYQTIANEAEWKHIPDRRIDIVALRRKVENTFLPGKFPKLHFIINQLLARTDDMANFIPFLLQVLWTAKCFKADIIHANNEPLCNRAALLAGKILRIPTVCHVRGDQDGSRLMKWAYTLPDHFISVSNWVAKSMQEKLHIPPGKISVVYDGIALEKLDINADGKEFRKQFNIAADAFAVGLVGLLILWKGQELFLDAAKQLRDKIPNLKMFIIGGTPDDCASYEKMLRQRVVEEQLENIVVFTGHVSRMEPIYNGLNIVVSASIDPEPLGTMVIECMAMGRPLIGPDHGGAAEMVEHGKTGLLFEARCADSLAESILQFYTNPHLDHQLGKAARIKALETFSVHQHTQKIQRIYQHLLGLTNEN
ncbi:MAG: glycosyltransferase family 4 protein [Methylobacter sp.]|nr:glycosyltransferase family 4 protein [Methylobacter sp.]